MAVQIKLEFKGLDKLQNLLANYPNEVGPRLRQASLKSALMVEREAKILSPVDSGRLRSSIATSLGVLDRGLTSIVSTNVEYAVYVHEGTRRMRGRPFMKQAVDIKESEIQSEFRNAIEQSIGAAKL